MRIGENWSNTVFLMSDSQAIPVVWDISIVALRPEGGPRQVPSRDTRIEVMLFRSRYPILP